MTEEKDPQQLLDDIFQDLDEIVAKKPNFKKRMDGVKISIQDMVLGLIEENDRQTQYLRNAIQELQDGPGDQPEVGNHQHEEWFDKVKDDLADCTEKHIKWVLADLGKRITRKMDVMTKQRNEYMKLICEKTAAKWLYDGIIERNAREAKLEEARKARDAKVEQEQKAEGKHDMNVWMLRATVPTPNFIVQGQQAIFNQNHFNMYINERNQAESKEIIDQLLKSNEHYQQTACFLSNQLAATNRNGEQYVMQMNEEIRQLRAQVAEMSVKCQAHDVHMHTANTLPDPSDEVIDLDKER